MAPERPGYNTSHQIAAILSKRGEWEIKFQAQVEDLEGVYSSDSLIFGELT
jgi:CTD kinase subunit beta